MEIQLDKEWVYLPESEDSAFRGFVLRCLAWAACFEQGDNDLMALADLFDMTLARRVSGALMWTKRTMGMFGTPVVVVLGIVFAIPLVMIIPILRLCRPDTKGVLGFVKGVKETHSRLLPDATKGQIELAVCAIYVSLVRGRNFQGRVELANKGPLPGTTAVGGSRRGSQRATSRSQRSWALVKRWEEKIGKVYGRTRYKYVERALRAWVVVRIKHTGDTVAACKEIERWDVEGLRTRAKTLEAIRPFDKAFGLKLKEGRRVAQVDKDGEEEG